MVELTVVEPLAEQDAPVILPELPPPDELFDELLEELVEELEEALEDVPPPELPEGIEHSFTDLAGFGSEPKVDTEQEKLPLNTL